MNVSAISRDGHQEARLAPPPSSSHGSPFPKDLVSLGPVPRSENLESPHLDPAAGQASSPPPPKSESPPPVAATEVKAPAPPPRVIFLEPPEPRLEAESKSLARAEKKPGPAVDPEQDIKDAQILWMEMLVGRQKHAEDLWKIIRDGQHYIYESIQESYIRRVKMQQKLLDAWRKAFFGWE